MYGGYPKPDDRNQVFDKDIEYGYEISEED